MNDKLNTLDLIEDSCLKIAEFARSLKDSVRAGENPHDKNLFVIARRELTHISLMLKEIENII